MSEMRGEVGKNTPKKEMEYPSFLWLYMADFLDTDLLQSKEFDR